MNKTNGGHRLGVHSLVLMNILGKYLVSGSFDHSIKIWDTVNFKLKHTFDAQNGGHSNWVWHMIQLSDGSLASASLDSTIKIWDMKEFALRKTLASHTSWVVSLVELSNGLLASGSDDFTIKVWDYKSGELKLTLDKRNGGHVQPVTSLIGLEGRGLMVSASQDGTIKFWNGSLFISST